MLPDYISKAIKKSISTRLDKCGGLNFFHHPPTKNKEYIRVDGNDYLSIGNLIDIDKKNNDQTLMSASLVGEDSIQRKFEKELALFLNIEDTILCQSGYLANLGLLQVLCNPEYSVYIDQFAHISLYEGALRGKPKRISRFLHNNIKSLNETITEPGIIIIDSVYSTNGILAPIQEIANIALEKNCILLVDESHSLGTHGEKGRGLCASLQINVPLFLTASLSKAFIGRGGIVGCPAEFSEYFRSESYPNIFSSAVQSYEAKTFIDTLETIKAADNRRTRLWNNVNFLRSNINKFWPIIGTEQIIAIEMDNSYKVLKLRNDLANEGILAAPFIPPAAKKSFVRISVNSALTVQEMNKIILALRKLC